MIRKVLRLSAFVFALSMIPSWVYAMANAPYSIIARSNLSTSSIDIIPANSEIPIVIEIADGSVLDQVYPYQVNLAHQTADGSAGWNDVIEMPASAIIEHAGQVVSIPAKIIASDVQGTHSYYFSATMANGSYVGLRTCYPTSFAIGQLTPTPSPTPAPKGKGRGKR